MDPNPFVPLIVIDTDAPQLTVQPAEPSSESSFSPSEPSSTFSPSASSKQGDEGDELLKVDDMPRLIDQIDF